MELDHSQRDTPRLGCNCKACYYTRQHNIEEALTKLWEKEQNFDGKQTVITGAVHQYLQYYLHGDCTYEEMKTKLIENLWQMQQSLLDEKIKGLEPLQKIQRAIQEVIWNAMRK